MRNNQNYENPKMDVIFFGEDTWISAFNSETDTSIRTQAIIDDENTMLTWRTYK